MARPLAPPAMIRSAVGRVGHREHRRVELHGADRLAAVAASQIRAVASSQAVSTRLPSGEKIAWRTGLGRRALLAMRKHVQHAPRRQVPDPGRAVVAGRQQQVVVDRREQALVIGRVCSGGNCNSLGRSRRSRFRPSIRAAGDHMLATGEKAGRGHAAVRFECELRAWSRSAAFQSAAPLPPTVSTPAAVRRVDGRPDRLLAAARNRDRRIAAGRVTSRRLSRFQRRTMLDVRRRSDRPAVCRTELPPAPPGSSAKANEVTFSGPR